MMHMSTITTEAGAVIPAWTVADRMVKAREFVGLNQQEMAERIGVGKRSITRYEASTEPPRAIVLAYSAVTHVPVWWLEYGDNPDESRLTPGYPVEISVIPPMFSVALAA